MGCEPDDGGSKLSVGFDKFSSRKSAGLSAGFNKISSRISAGLSAGFDKISSRKSAGLSVVEADRFLPSRKPKRNSVDKHGLKSVSARNVAGMTRARVKESLDVVLNLRRDFIKWRDSYWKVSKVTRLPGSLFLCSCAPSACDDACWNHLWLPMLLRYMVPL